MIFQRGHNGNLSSVKGTEHDPYYLLDKAVAEDKQIPKLLIMCGKQDFYIKTT